VFQPCLVLQKRHLPDQPLEYLLKLRCELKSGVKYRERWIAVDKLLNECDIGAALVKQFEASKVGQLAVDTNLSKLRSLPSPVSEENHLQSRTAADVKQEKKDAEPAGKALKRKSFDLERRHTLCNCFDGAASKSLKSNYVVNGSSSVPCVNRETVHKPLSFYGASPLPVSPHRHFAKRLLLSDKVPRRDWSKNSTKVLKLPSLVHSKPMVPKSAAVVCKVEDSDSDADIRYSLATGHSDTSSDQSDTELHKKLTGSSEKKRNKLVLVNGVKKNKHNSVESKRKTKDDEDTEVIFKPANLSSAQNNCKAGIVTE